MNSSPPTPNPSFNPPFSQFTDSSAGIRHVTIKQVLKAAHVETHFEIDGQPVGFIVLLANVYDTTLKGGRLNYGLDDGTGRINAFSWVTDESYAEREVAEYNQEPFVYARVIGRISEYRGIYSIQLEKINRVVKSYEEICHHFLICMVETRMCEEGLPSRAVVQAASDAAKINCPAPEPKPWRNDVSGMADAGISNTPSSPPPPRTPSPVTYQTLKRSPVTEPRAQRPQMSITPSSTSASQPNTAPQRKTYQTVNFPSPGPNRETPSPSPLHVRQRQPSRSSPVPVRLKSPSGPSAASTAAVNHYRASPEFVSTTSPPLFPSAYPGTESRQGGEDTRMRSPPTREMPETVQHKRVAGGKVLIGRDPYSHLSDLQRDIILTVQNATFTSGKTEGMALGALVRMIASHRPGISETELSEAFNALVDEDYIYNTIDETHFACKM